MNNEVQGPMKAMEALKSDHESLMLFVTNLAEFDKKFCDFMMRGVDFNLKLEVHGDASQLLYCRIDGVYFDRTKEGKKELSKKGSGRR